MTTTIDTRALIERCDIHATTADDHGLYTTANTLWLAARKLEQLHAELANAIDVANGLARGKPEAVADACYADCVSPNVPAGHDTILGYLAKHHPDILDLIDPDYPGDTVRDGWALANEAKRRGLDPVYVDAPPILQRAGIFQVRAYPLDMLQKRWG